MEWDIVIGRERSVGAGWAFAVEVSCDGRSCEHNVLLSWVDYDYWCGGASSPADVVRHAILTALQAKTPTQFGERFDCSTLRRCCPGFDDAMRLRLGRCPAAHEPGTWTEQPLRKAG
ncbi:MAG: hypothetical protein KDA20_11765 [Phycisphaerales bacterium]|nr:hypothetical protein [Phycisphaerales bacterium]